MKKSLTQHAKKNLSEVHALSRRYNGKAGDHARKLIALVKKHAQEIEELHGRRDPHYAVEVGDLLILCHELLLEEGRDADAVLEKCYRRYKEKLKELLDEDVKRKRK